VAAEVGLEFEHLGLQVEGFEQFLDALPVVALVVTTSCRRPTDGG
jgi:hypothetical protein